MFSSAISIGRQSPRLCRPTGPHLARGDHAAEEGDRIVEAKHSDRMHKALKKEGKVVEFVELKREGHNGWSLENDILYLETIEAFLAEHLPVQ